MPASALPPQTDPARNSRQPLLHHKWLPTLLLVVLVFAAYAPVFNAGFIWDDESHLTQNPCVVGPLGLKEVWTTARAVYYPLVLTTFWALHRIVGLTPWPYHLLNVLLHAGSALLLWQVLKQLKIRGAWLGAGLWAVHPVMVQSVAWITELKNTQSCFFYLLSIFWFLRWGDATRLSRGDDASDAGEISGGLPRQSKDRAGIFLSLSLFFFVLATLSKSSVVMLPVVLALCVWWRTGGINRSNILTLVPFVLVSAVASVWTIFEQKFHAGAIGADWAQSWPERFIIAGHAIWFYLLKLVWPNPLIFIYPRWQFNSVQLSAYLPFVAALGGLLVLWWLPTKYGRGLFFAAAYYVVSLFPVLGFFDVFFFRYSFVSDHFQYLASMGPLALAGAGITMGCDWLALSSPFAISSKARRHSAMSTALVCGIGGALLVFLVFLTSRQAGIYHDLVSLYTATLSKSPGCWMAHYNLGIALNERGKTDEAIAHYQEAIRLRSGYAEAHYNLGRLLAQKGQLENAVVQYEKVLEINPADAEAQNNLGVTLFGSGNVDEAIARYREALKIRPDYSEASCNLANALLSEGDLDGAIANYSACLAKSPNNAEAQYNLASALLRKGRTDEAIVHYQKTLEMQADNADAYANLGSALLAKGRVQNAIDAYRSALRIAPGNVPGLSNLAWLLATSSNSSLRNGSEAVLLAEKADSESSRSENHPIVLRILAAAYAESGRFDKAKQTAQQALQAAEIQGNSALATALRDEIALYDLGLPYHKEH